MIPHKCRKSVAVLLIIALLGTAPVFAEPSTASDIVSVQSTTSNPTSTISSQTSSENANSSEILSNMLSSNTDPDSNIDSSLDSSPESIVIETSSAIVASSGNNTVVSRQTSSRRSNQQTQSISSEWNSNLNNILNNACDWLKNKEEGDMYFVALGGAGKSAGTQEYVMFMNDISKSTTYTQLYPLAMNTLNATFCGVNASNVQGINLINQISGFSDAENSQTKALAYTLIALDSNAYTVPDNSVLTRETLRQHLMKRQLENGSFQMLDEKDNALETTALALTALSGYSSDDNTQSALKKGVEYLQNMQSGNQRRSAFLDESCNTVSQIITALNSLKINVNDSRFINNRKSLDQRLLAFLGSDGGFKKYATDTQSDLEATELAIIALTSIKYCSNPYLLKQQVPDSTSSEAPPYTPSSPNFWWLIALLSVVFITSGCVVIWICRKKSGKNKISKDTN